MWRTLLKPRSYSWKWYANICDLPHFLIRLPVQVQGDNLADVFDRLSMHQIMTVCARLGEVLVKLFACRGPYIGSETHVVDSPPRTAEEAAFYRAPVLLSWPFDEGPLAGMPPQEAATSTHDYLLALSKRPERIFDGSDPQAAAEGRNTGWPSAPSLTNEDIVVIRDTWNRLGSLIPYHSGGFYIPGTLSPEARYAVYSVLQNKEFGVRHADLRLSRIFVRWARPGADDSDCALVLTGWEHAHRAPLWSCARMPPWLTPHVHPEEPLSWEHQRKLRATVIRTLAASGAPVAKEWIIANAYGETERWFEGMLSAHWGFRDTNEVLLVHLRAHWIRERPDVPFPLRVGGAYVSRIDLPALRGIRPPDIADPQSVERWAQEVRTREIISKGKHFVEEVRVALNALGLGEAGAPKTQESVQALGLNWPLDDID
jgi:hypothetical protein